MSSYRNPPTTYSDVSESLESDVRFADDRHHTSNYTRSRPPHLNDRNFPSSQINGIMADSSHAANDGPAANRGNIYNPQRRYGLSSQSTTESTATGPTVRGDTDVAKAIAVRSYLHHFINQDYDSPTMQPLTEQAVDALNHCHRAGCHGVGNIREWIDGGVFPVVAAEVEAEAGPTSALGASMHALGDGPRSRLTMATSGSARSIGSAARHAHLDRMAENVCAAGWQFDDVPAYPACLDIGDEDIV